jgi:hypothetical protein
MESKFELNTFYSDITLNYNVFSKFKLKIICTLNQYFNDNHK